MTLRIGQYVSPGRGTIIVFCIVMMISLFTPDGALLFPLPILIATFLSMPAYRQKRVYYPTFALVILLLCIPWIAIAGMMVSASAAEEKLGFAVVGFYVVFDIIVTVQIIRYLIQQNKCFI